MYKKHDNAWQEYMLKVYWYSAGAIQSSALPSRHKGLWEGARHTWSLPLPLPPIPDDGVLRPERSRGQLCKDLAQGWVCVWPVRARMEKGLLVVVNLTMGQNSQG